MSPRVRMTGGRYIWTMMLFELLCYMLGEQVWSSRTGRLLMVCGVVIVLALVLALLLDGARGAGPEHAW